MGAQHIWGNEPQVKLPYSTIIALLVIAKCVVLYIALVFLLALLWILLVVHSGVQKQVSISVDLIGKSLGGLETIKARWRRLKRRDKKD